MIYEDNQTKVYFGDVRSSLAGVPDASIHACVTSPPYFNLRAYLPKDHQKKGSEIGLEGTPEEYIESLVSVFGEVRRVLRDDGTLWLNLGDGYARQGSDGAAGKNALVRNTREGVSKRLSRPPEGYKHKDLMLMPHRVAMALQEDGWYLRSAVVWNKPNPMPESVTDRPTSSYEMIFLMSKSPRYYYDAEAIREEARDWGSRNREGTRSRDDSFRNGSGGHSGLEDGNFASSGRNARNVWTITTRPYREAHFATYPVELPIRCIKASTSEHGVCASCGAPYERVSDRGVEARKVENSDLDRYGNGSAGVHRKIGGQYTKWMKDNPKKTTGWNPTCSCDADVVPATVLDPFMGSGTTALAAKKLGRKAVGVEIDERCEGLISNRLGQDTLFV